MKKTEKTALSGKALTGKKQLFIEYLSSPENHDSPEAFASRIGVDLNTLCRWKADSRIVQSAFQRSVTIFGAEIPKVLGMLLQKALEDKDVSACKLFFQQVENIKDAPETGITPDEALILINKALAHSVDSESATDKKEKRN